MSVDVVVVTRDTRKATLRCLGSVAGARSLGRLVVVDNASSDGTAEAVREAFPSAAVVERDEALGFGAACNLGAAQGEAELVLFLNSDAAAREGALDRLAAQLAATPGAVAAAGRLVSPGTDEPQVGFAVRGFPTLAGQLAVLSGLERAWPANPLSRRQAARDFDYATTHETDLQPAGACLLCRRSAFEEIGGFDEAFPFWFEDVDLVRRLRDAGRILYVHDAVFEHEGGLSVRERPGHELIGARYDGLVRYFDKHGSVPERAGIRAAAALAGAARAAVALAGRRRREAAAHLHSWAAAARLHR
jgi:GT2 family glycosyltransferase